MMDIYIDIDAHKVLPQVLHAARRHDLELYVIIRDYLDVDTNVHLILAEDRQSNCGAWIGSNILRGDICVTGNPEVAGSCIRRGALALTPLGALWKGDMLSDDVRSASGRVTERWADARMFRQLLERAIATQGIGSSAFVAPRELPRETAQGSSLGQARHD